MTVPFAASPVPKNYSGTGNGTGVPRDPFVYTGVGGSPVVFDIDYQGSDDFRIFVVAATGDEYERLLTTDRSRGPYRGARALSYRDGTLEDHSEEFSAFKIRVEGTGAWQVRVGLPNLASTALSAVTGTGDEVIGPFNLTGSGPSADFRFLVTHTGSRFSARLIASDGTWRQLVPPQSASFIDKRAPVNVYSSPNAGELPFGNYVLAIEADGQWTVRVIEL